MKILDRISMLLNSKGNEIWSVPPGATVYSAIEMMADKHVGAILVIDNKRLVGVVSERDYARKVILKGRSSADTFVREIMTENPITITTNCSVDDAMRVMTVNRIRHLPAVCKNTGELKGVVSLGDLVKWIISSQDMTIEHLEHYITGQYPC